MKLSFKFASALFVVVIFPLMGWCQSTLNFPIPVDVASGEQIGYAVVNPTPDPAGVTFTVFDEFGTVTGVASVSVPAGGQFARLFSELFANSHATGWVQATSNVSGLQGFTMGGDFVYNVDGTASVDAAANQVFPLMGDTTSVVLANPA